MKNQMEENSFVHKVILLGMDNILILNKVYYKSFNIFINILIRLKAEIWSSNPLIGTDFYIFIKYISLPN